MPLREKPRLNPKPPTTGARILHAPAVLRGSRLSPDKEGHARHRPHPGRLQDLHDAGLPSRKHGRRGRPSHTIAISKSGKVTNGACILIDYKGRILAEVGGVDYNKDQYYAVTDGQLQPGSSFKSFLYATAIDKGIIGEDSSVSNERKTYVDQWGITWNPENDNGRYSSSASVKTAFRFLLQCLRGPHSWSSLGPDHSCRLRAPGVRDYLFRLTRKCLSCARHEPGFAPYGNGPWIQRVYDRWGPC